MRAKSLAPLPLDQAPVLSSHLDTPWQVLVGGPPHYAKHLELLSTRLSSSYADSGLAPDEVVMQLKYLGMS